MPKDLKHRVPAINQPQPLRVTPRMGLGLITAFLFIAVLAAGYQRFDVASRVLPPSLLTPPAPLAEPDFSFFKLLPDAERQIPETDINAALRDVKLGKAPVAGQFFLQAGAFTRLDQAEALKTHLATLGPFRPRLEQIKLEYATWYRVKLGPYRTLPDVDQVRQFLRGQAIDSIVQAPLP